VWTPKRILIAFSGLLVCLAGYGVYLYFLGDIDSLPPLPREYWEVEGGVAPPIAITPDLRWYQAFGPDCEEVNRIFKLELQSKGWGMAANKFDIESDGRVKLTPFSAYVFPRARKNAKFPEINIVRCEEAYLTMDRPVTKMGDLSNRRIVGVELRTTNAKQGVLIINNRGTLEKNDDVDLRITNGPLFFDDNKSLVWTNGYVQVMDNGTQPEPTTVRAKGMELYLNKETSTSPRDKQRKTDSSASGSIDKLILLSNVDMHVFMDSKSGFLAGTQPAKTKAAPGKSEKSHLVIKTNGPFTFEVEKDIARFECPKPSAGADALGGEHVLVQREHIIDGGKTKYDQLLCNTLVLEFRKKDPALRNTGERGMNKDIAKGHATAYPGREVILVMETQNLDAYGEEMIYWKGSETMGAQTIVRGKPLNAVKDGHKIAAHELHLIGADKDGKGQKAFAKGPGKIELLDKAKNTYPMEAQWKDILTVETDSEKGADGVEIPLDLLTFKDDAVFRDKEQGKELRAWRIQVWLEAAKRDKSLDTGETTPQPATPVSKQKLHKIDAYKNVSANSPELVIPRSERVIVRFRELPKDDGLPAAAAVDTLPGVLPKTDDPGVLPPVSNDAGTPSAGVSSMLPGGNADKKDRKPIVLEAREVAAYFTRGAKTDLQELVTEGGVHVHQDGKAADDKGIDITGEMLNLLHDLKGDQLFVYGDTRKPAQLQLGELVLIGPKVTINQQTNFAEVEGIGAMTLPSNTTFDGSKPAKSGTRLTIHWNKNMLFNGQYADFHGGIVAYQDNAKMQCQTLQVSLDKAVSFKNGQKSGQNAKVDKLLCDRNVYILDEKKDSQGGLQQYNRLEARELIMDNQEGRTNGVGPGMVYLIAPGPVDPALAPAAANQPKASAKQEMKLTRISFFERMFSSKKPDSRNAKFYGNVEVFHVAANNPDVKLDADKLPKNGFFLRCDLLSVYSKNLAEGKSSQMMHAEGKVDFRAEKFYGQSTTVKYDDSSEIIVFEGADGNPVRLFQDVGAPQLREIRGSKILYNRRTGQFQSEGVRSIETPSSP